MPYILNRGIMMPGQEQKLSFVEEKIREITHAPARFVPILEKIMRREVFHGTLDWQASAQFNTGARKAKRMFLKASAFYIAEHAMDEAVCRRFFAEGALARAKSDGDANAISAAETALADALAEQERAISRFNRISGLDLAV